MPSKNDTPADLSHTQQALLQSAIREGYFDVPRQISTAKLAEKHEMGSQEVLEEIHQGVGIAVRDHISSR